ncbi:hypothetical protein M514_28031 [Trichuris suis]|uniref:Uncharacterized protein n=1 Tax=Trichuris suis TaxID=68888 RepID=A0A085MRE4_9BILA|nr:hypothetical protein M514_28031 [Trichuris suis]
MAFCTIECKWKRVQMEELKHYKSTEKADHNGSDEKKLMKPNVNSMSSNGVQMRQIMNELMNIWNKATYKKKRTSWNFSGDHSTTHVKVIACGVPLKTLCHHHHHMRGVSLRTPCQSHRMRGYHSKLHLKVIACGGTPEPHVKVIVCGGTTQISMPERLHGGGTPKTACQNHCMRGYLQNACQNDCMEGARPKIARQNHCMRGYHSRITGGRVRKPTTSPV